MNQEISVKIAEGGRLIIPSAVRKQLGIEIGDELILRLEEGELRLLTKQQALSQAREVLNRYIPKNHSLADELIAERRNESYRE